MTVTGTPSRKATVGAAPVNSSVTVMDTSRRTLPQLGHPDLAEEAVAVAQRYRYIAYRIPQHVAKAAQARELLADAIPVRMQRHIGRRADAVNLSHSAPEPAVEDGQRLLAARSQRPGSVTSASSIAPVWSASVATV